MLKIIAGIKSHSKLLIINEYLKSRYNLMFDIFEIEISRSVHIVEHDGIRFE